MRRERIRRPGYDRPERTAKGGFLGGAPLIEPRGVATPSAGEPVSNAS
jgi:hypothetical protein